MTSLNNPVNLPLDTNGYVKSSIWGQNMNPNVNNVGGSVAGSVASVTGDIGGNVVGSVANGNIISHQTGLSAAVSTADTPVNIGSAIAITTNGVVKIEISAHTSGDVAGIRIARTRSSVVDYINHNPIAETSSVMKSSLFADGVNAFVTTFGIGSTVRVHLNKITVEGTATDNEDIGVLFLNVLNGDSLQFQVGNNTASTTVYIDDLLVMQ